MILHVFFILCHKFFLNEDLTSEEKMNSKISTMVIAIWCVLTDLHGLIGWDPFDPPPWCHKEKGVFSTTKTNWQDLKCWSIICSYIPEQIHETNLPNKLSLLNVKYWTWHANRWHCPKWEACGQPDRDATLISYLCIQLNTKGNKLDCNPCMLATI